MTLQGLTYGSYYTRTNHGPINVRGGRHMLSIWTDCNEEFAEMNEFDNQFARQWVWTPLVLSQNVPVIRDAPPDPFGGAISIDPLMYAYNCDGLYLSLSSSAYYAVTIRALNNAADYDCRLHPASTGATNGFSRYGAHGVVASSYRPAGCLDAVFMDIYNSGSYYWNVGVVNLHDDTVDYEAVKLGSENIAFNTSVTVTLAADQYMALRAFDVPHAQSLSLSLDSDPALGPLQLLWLDNTFTTGDLLD